MEGVEGRTLRALAERGDLVVFVVSFISLFVVLPVVRDLMTDGPIVALFKPQFEARKNEVPRGGVIRGAQLHAVLLGRFVAWCVKNDFRVLDMSLSPLAGTDGNREFFFWLRPKSSSAGEVGGRRPRGVRIE